MLYGCIRHHLGKCFVVNWRKLKPSIMKIVFLTDLTDKSLENIKSVLPIVINDRENTEVVLLHVIDANPIDEFSINQRSEKAIKQLFTEKRKIAEVVDINITPIVRSGNYISELDAALERLAPDLVVFVSESKRDLGQNDTAFFKLIGEIVSPVLIMSSEDILDGIQGIGLAIDKKENPKSETLKKVKRISSYLNSNVKAFHIVTNEEEEGDFYENVGKEMGVGQIEMVQEQEVTNGIRSWCKNNSIDIPVVLTSRKGFFQRIKSCSVTHSLVKENPGALLIITQ